MLSRRAEVVPLPTLLSQIRAGRRERPVVAITFDDGYADNLHNALPLLERYGAPATVFLATAWIGRAEQFWWDRLSAIVMSINPVPPRVNLRVGDDEFTWERSAKSDKRDRATNELHLAVWSKLVVAKDHDREVAMDHLLDYATCEPEIDSTTRPMTQDELRRMASSPLIEIGAHTTSHCSLPDLPPETQLEEIEASRQQCRAFTGEFPSSFAYPFGDLDADTPELVKSAGFERACSTQSELVWDDTNAMLLPRIQVPDCGTRGFSMRLRFRWLP